MTPSWPNVVARIRTLVEPRGLDLVQPFCVRWYNELRSPHHPALPDFARPALGIVVGNSRVLWKTLEDAVASDPSLQSAADPLDAWVEASFDSLAAELRLQHELFFAHDIALPIQRIAEAAGLARLSPSHLSVHALHGPWIALRAVLVVDCDGPTDKTPLFDPCTPCHKPCLAALEHALAVTGDPTSADAVQQSWRAWLAVRDACPVGRAARYSNAQIEYHYTKARRLLERTSDR